MKHLDKKHPLHTCQIKIDNPKPIEQYENVLGLFTEWKSFKREIKILNITEPKRIEFEIKQIKSISPNFFGRYKKIDEDKISDLSQTAFLVRGIKLVINQNNLIESIHIDLRTIDSEIGNIVEDRISNQKILFKELFIEDKFICFFAEI